MLCSLSLSLFPTGYLTQRAISIGRGDDFNNTLPSQNRNPIRTQLTESVKHKHWLPQTAYRSHTLGFKSLHVIIHSHAKYNFWFTAVPDPNI